MKQNRAFYFVIFLLSVVASCTANKNGYFDSQDSNIDSDISKCDKIMKDRWRVACIIAQAVNTKNPELCKGLSEYPEYLCYQTISNFAEDLSLCDEMKDVLNENKQLIDVCKDNVYAKMAISRGDLSVCDQSTRKDDCYMQFAEANADLSVCEKIESINEKNSCVLKVASVKKDEKICDSDLFTDTVFKSSCFEDIAIAKKDFLLCSRAAPFENNCYLALGQELTDLSICEKISYNDPGRRDNCILSVAVSKNDTSICEKISNQISKASCFIEIAVSKNDTSICEQVPEKDYGTCLSSLKYRDREDRNQQIEEEINGCYLAIYLELGISSNDKINGESLKDLCSSGFVESNI